MSTKLDELFATLRILIADTSRDLALAMAELRSVAQQRDKALTERDAARAGYSAMNTRIYGPGGECHELDKARAERDKLKIERDSANWSLSRAKESLRAAEADAAETESVNSDLALAMAELRAVEAERDKAQIECCEANARADFADLAAERRGVELEKLRLVHRDAVAGWNKAALERDNARQSLRAAEQEVEELDTLCNDFRRANARLVAERDAAMERLNHAESIIMQ